MSVLSRIAAVFPCDPKRTSGSWAGQSWGDTIRVGYRRVGRGVVRPSPPDLAKVVPQAWRFAGNGVTAHACLLPLRSKLALFVGVGAARRWRRGNHRTVSADWAISLTGEKFTA